MPLMADSNHTAGRIRVEEYVGLLSSCVLKFVKDGPVQDSDLYSVGCLALMEAARTFDPSKAKFCTWATRIINQRIIDEIKRIARVRETCSDLSLHPDEESEQLPLHLLPDLLDGDGDDERMVVGHYLEGKSLSELGREFGFSKEWVRKKIQSAVSKIRRDNLVLLEAYL